MSLGRLEGLCAGMSFGMASRLCDVLGMLLDGVLGGCLLGVFCGCLGEVSESLEDVLGYVFVTLGLLLGGCCGDVFGCSFGHVFGNAIFVGVSFRMLGMLRFE